MFKSHCNPPPPFTMLPHLWLLKMSTFEANRYVVKAEFIPIKTYITMQSKKLNKFFKYLFKKEQIVFLYTCIVLEMYSVTVRNLSRFFSLYI